MALHCSATMDNFSVLGFSEAAVLINVSNETSSLLKNSGVHAFTFYFTGLCICAGLLGNSTSILVFLKSRVSESACTVRYYLIALAVSDNTVLMAEATLWLADEPLKIAWIHKFRPLCKVTYYLRYAGRMWSALLTLTITAERFLFVAYPLKSASLRTANWCRVGIALTAVASFSLGSYALFLISITEEHFCVIISQELHTFVVVDIVISRCGADVLVGLAIFILTGFMIRALLKARHARENTLNGGCTYTRRQTRELQITTMLTTIAILFVVMKIPYTITYYLSFNWNQNWKKIVATRLPGIDLGKELAGALVNINYSINFFVYLLFVRSFRENFLKMCSCRKYHHVSDHLRGASSDSYKVTSAV